MIEYFAPLGRARKVRTVSSEAVAHARRLVGGWRGGEPTNSARARARAQVLGLYCNVTSLFGHSFAERLPGIGSRR